MPRPIRTTPTGYPLHIHHRGNNRQPIFSDDNDRDRYLELLIRSAVRFQLDVHAWVLMTNHTHLVATPKQPYAAAQAMQHLGRLYVPLYNKKYDRTGGLFDGRYRSHLITDDRYLLNCICYVELNPVRAGIVQHPESFPWSSYSCHAFGNKNKLWTPHSLYLDSGELAQCQRAHRKRLSEKLPDASLQEIRLSLRTGSCLGSDPGSERGSDPGSDPGSEQGSDPGSDPDKG